MTIELGQAVSSQLFVNEWFGQTGPASYSGPSGTTDEEHFSALAGVRWEPALGSPDLLRALFPLPGICSNLEAVSISIDAGIRYRDRSSSVDETKLGPSVSAGISYLPIQGHDWKLGIQIGFALAGFSDEGIQRVWSYSLVVHVGD